MDSNDSNAADETVRRKRLLFRSWHRGTKETDLLVGSFARHHLAEMTAQQLATFEDLLEENDADLFDWITGKTVPPADRDSDVLRLMRAFRFPDHPA